MNDLREVCIQFHLPVEPELLCQLNLDCFRMVKARLI